MRSRRFPSRDWKGYHWDTMGLKNIFATGLVRGKKQEHFDVCYMNILYIRAQIANVWKLATIRSFMKYAISIDRDVNGD